jgi:hypothetical protein
MTHENELVRRIEEWFARRSGLNCLFVPSGRVAIYLALRGLLSPGARVLMSPINCDAVLFSVLAAGARPVMSPVSSGDGNLDLKAISASTWARADAVLTTNLYGMPDDVREIAARCRALGIPLIEDAAQALESEVEGRAVGSFGDLAVFTLSKHVGAPAGGILAFRDGSLRPTFEAALADVTASRPRLRQLADLTLPKLEAFVRKRGMVRPGRHIARLMGQLPREAGDRIPLDNRSLATAMFSGQSLPQFDAWLSWDLPAYRMQVPLQLLSDALRRLYALGSDRRRRADGVRQLAEHPGVAGRVRSASSNGLLAVPLFLEERDRARAELAARGIPVRYVYDPPLDDYAPPELLEPSSDPTTARWWAGHVLPVDPLYADAAIRVVDRFAAAAPVDGVQVGTAS